MKLYPIPVGTGAQAAATPLHCQNRPFDLTHAGSSQRPPSANLDDFLPQVPQLDDGTTGLDCNDAMEGAMADKRVGSRRMTNHPYHMDADDRLYSTVARQSARGR